MGQACRNVLMVDLRRPGDQNTPIKIRSRSVIVIFAVGGVAIVIPPDEAPSVSKAKRTSIGPTENIRNRRPWIRVFRRKSYLNFPRLESLLIHRESFCLTGKLWLWWL